MRSGSHASHASRLRDCLLGLGPWADCAALSLGDGRQVFRCAVGAISEAVEGALEQSGFKSGDIHWFLPHQANKRIIDGVARRRGLAPEQVVLTPDRPGNISAASIPLALADAVADRRINRGDLVMLEAMGGGYPGGQPSSGGSN